MEKRSSGLLAAITITITFLGLTSFLFFYFSSPESRNINFYVAYGYLLFIELLCGIYLSLVYTARAELRTKGMWDFFFILGIIIFAFSLIGVLTVILFGVLNLIISTSKALLTAVVVEVALLLGVVSITYFLKARTETMD